MARNMTITLPDEMVALVRGAVQSGDYGGISEVFREALREWKLTHAVQIADMADRVAGRAAGPTSI
jgi:antitoxin ParD1/3/4